MTCNTELSPNRKIAPKRYNKTISYLPWTIEKHQLGRYVFIFKVTISKLFKQSIKITIVVTANTTMPEQNIVIYNNISKQKLR